MDVIGLWLVTVPGMDDCPPLEGEIRCFWHMFTIIQILRRGNIADLPRLKKEIEERHRLYFKVFPLGLKPKLHFLWHIPDCWAAWQSLISCYGAEADHREVCKIFRFNTKDPSTASIYHAMHELFEAVGKWTTYEAVCLIEPVAPCNQVCEVGGETWLVTHTSQQLQAEFGIIRKKRLCDLET